MISEKLFAETVDSLQEQEQASNCVELFGISLQMDGVEKELVFKNEITNLRSITKLVLGLVVGVLISNNVEFEGKRLSLSMPIYPLLKDELYMYADQKTIEFYKEMTILHLMTNTSGHEKGFMFSSELKKSQIGLIENLLCKPIKYKPGIHFSYSNFGPYLISYIITKYTGKTVERIADELLFKPMNITSYRWDKYGEFTKGSTGLQMNSIDLKKMTELLFNYGEYEGTQVVEKEWIREMTKVHYRNVPKDNLTRLIDKDSYGLLLWISDSGYRFIDGTDGQYIFVNFQQRITGTFLGKSTEKHELLSCLKKIII